MNTETKQKETYEAPEVLDIEPVTVCRGDSAGGTGENNDDW